MALGHLVVTVLAAGAVIRKYPPVWSAADVRDGIRVGLPTVPHNLAGNSTTSVLIVIAGLLVGRNIAGELQIAIFTGSAPLLFINALNNSWALQVYSAKPGDRGKLIEQTSRTMASLALIFALAAASASPLVIKILATPEMNRQQMSQVAAIVACATPIFVLYLANLHPVFAAGKTKLLAITTPLSAAIALTIPTLFTEFASDGAVLLGMAAGIGPFYVLQTLFAIMLRRRVGFGRLDLVIPVTLAFASVAGCLFIAWLNLTPVAGAICAVVISLLGLAYIAKTFRAPEQG